MVLARNPRVTTISSKPCSFSSRTMCSIMGRFASGIMAFCWFDVSGLSLLPSPPARITAFTQTLLFCDRAYPAFFEGTLGEGNVGDRRVVAQQQSGDREHPRE